MPKKLLQASLVIVIVFSTLACAAKRPVLAPNAQLESVGPTAAQQDVDDCLRQAAAGGLESTSAGKVAGSTALGAVTGAAVGAASGAVFGSAGRGAAAGAAGGAAGGLLQALLHPFHRDLDQEQRRLVEQCLKEKGYEVSGWK